LKMFPSPRRGINF